MVVSVLAFAIVNSATQWVSFIMGYHPANVALCQYGIATAVMMPWMFAQGFRRSLQTNQLWIHIIRVATAVIGVQFWLWSMAWPIPIWQAIALLMTSPLFVTVGSVLFLRERVDTARWIAVMAGFIGAMVILEPWSEIFSLATLLPVIAAVFWAIYSLMTKVQCKTESPTTLVFYLFALTVPFNLFIAMPVLVMPDAGMWPLLLVAGGLTGLAQLALTRAYQCADAAYLQPFDLAKLPLNVLVGFWVMGTVPPGQLWFGGSLIIGATLFITWRENIHREDSSLAVA